jgi:uncharacterized membrane protein
MTRWRRALPPLVRGLLAFVGLAPFAPWALRGVPVLHFVGDVCDAWFAAQCHRDPYRSLALAGRVLPVCLRCFGIYLGLGLGGLVARPRLRPWPLRLWVGAAALAMVLDVASEAWGLRSAFAPTRLLTGVALAYPVGVALVWAARGVAGDSDPQRQAE